MFPVLLHRTAPIYVNITLLFVNPAGMPWGEKRDVVVLIATKMA